MPMVHHERHQSERASGGGRTCGGCCGSSGLAVGREATADTFWRLVIIVFGVNIIYVCLYVLNVAIRIEYR